MRIFPLALLLKEKGHIPVVLLYSEKAGNLFISNGICTEYLDTISKCCTNQFTDLTDAFVKSELLNVEGLRRPEILWPSAISKTIRSVKKTWNLINIIINKHKPDRVCIWNGYTGFVANCLRVIAQRKQIGAAYLERGLLRNSLFIDSQGTNGASRISKKIYDIPDEDGSITIAKKLFELPDFWTPNKSSGREVVFVPMQVQHDTNILLYSKYRSMREFFLEVYNELNNDNRVFIVRPHPEEQQQYPLNIPRFDNVIVDAHDLLDNQIEKADIVVTINSTVGLQALIKGKSVIANGDGIFRQLDCLSTFSDIRKTADIKEVNKLLAALVKYNLVFEDNPFNDIVLSNQLDIDADGKNTFSRAPKLPFPTRNVKILIDFCFGVRLNLTYRKSSEKISLQYIETILLQNNILSYEFVREQSEANLIITDKPYSEIPLGIGKKVIDIYGVELN